MAYSPINFLQWKKFGGRRGPGNDDVFTVAIYFNYRVRNGTSSYAAKSFYRYLKNHYILSMKASCIRVIIDNWLMDQAFQYWTTTKQHLDYLSDKLQSCIEYRDINIVRTIDTRLSNVNRNETTREIDMASHRWHCSAEHWQSINSADSTSVVGWLERRNRKGLEVWPTKPPDEVLTHFIQFIRYGIWRKM